jgi:hypothetical protein
MEGIRGTHWTGALGRPHTNCVKTSIKTWDKRRSLASFVIQTRVRTPKQHVSASYHIFSSWRYDVIMTHVDNVHWCCSLSTDVWVMTHRKGTCRVLLHVPAAWSWRQHHDSDRCAPVFIISFVSTVLLSLRHVAYIVSWLLHVLTHAGVRPN